MEGKGILYIMSLGFTEEQARYALIINDGDKERATEYLLLSDRSQRSYDLKKP
jgi:hypothetical protein